MLVLCLPSACSFCCSSQQLELVKTCHGPSVMAALFAFEVISLPSCVSMERHRRPVAGEGTAAMPNIHDLCGFSRIHARARPREETRHLPSLLLCLQISWKRMSGAKSPGTSPTRGVSLDETLGSPVVLHLLTLTLSPEIPHPHVAPRASNSQ